MESQKESKIEFKKLYFQSCIFSIALKIQLCFTNTASFTGFSTAFFTAFKNTAFKNTTFFTGFSTAFFTAFSTALPENGFDYRRSVVAEGVKSPL